MHNVVHEDLGRPPSPRCDDAPKHPVIALLHCYGMKIVERQGS